MAAARRCRGATLGLPGQAPALVGPSAWALFASRRVGAPWSRFSAVPGVRLATGFAGYRGEGLTLRLCTTLQVPADGMDVDEGPLHDGLGPFGLGWDEVMWDRDWRPLLH